MDELGELVCKILRVDSGILGEEENFRDSKDWDSLSHMDLIATIEERWKVTLSNEEIVGMRCLADIRRALRAHRAEGFA